MTNFEEYYLYVQLCSTAHNDAPTRDRSQSRELFARARREQTMLARLACLRKAREGSARSLSLVVHSLHADRRSNPDTNDVIKLLTSCAITHGKFVAWNMSGNWGCKYSNSENKFPTRGSQIFQRSKYWNIGFCILHAISCIRDIQIFVYMLRIS